jgi:CheY-like chemotaxis protein
MVNVVAPKVMIVGDDTEFAYLMQRYAAQGGYRAFVAGANPGVLALVRQELPMCILMDVESPCAQSWDILRMLKVDPDTRDIPVVICSWLDDEAHSLKEGAEAYLRKPVMYDDIVMALQDVGIRIGQD